MTLSRKLLCAIYALIAVFALIGTWANNLSYVGGGFLDTNAAFWRDTLANPASRSVTVDLLFLVVAVAIWMVLEARRLQMRGVWLYVFFGAAVAISVTVPLFLLHRERALAAAESAHVGGACRKSDVIGLILVAAAALAYMVIALPWSSR